MPFILFQAATLNSRKWKSAVSSFITFQMNIAPIPSMHDNKNIASKTFQTIWDHKRKIPSFKIYPLEWIIYEDVLNLPREDLHQFQRICELLLGALMWPSHVSCTIIQSGNYNKQNQLLKQRFAQIVKLSALWHGKVSKHSELLVKMLLLMRFRTKLHTY